MVPFSTGRKPVLAGEATGVARPLKKWSSLPAGSGGVEGRGGGQVGGQVRPREAVQGVLGSLLRCRRWLRRLPCKPVRHHACNRAPAAHLRPPV